MCWFINLTAMCSSHKNKTGGTFDVQWCLLPSVSVSRDATMPSAAVIFLLDFGFDRGNTVMTWPITERFNHFYLSQSWVIWALRSDSFSFCGCSVVILALLSWRGWALISSRLSCIYFALYTSLHAPFIVLYSFQNFNTEIIISAKTICWNISSVSNS